MPRSPAALLAAALVAALLPPALGALAGRPAAAAAKPEVTRTAGPDRYATAAAVSRRAFPDGATVVHLATGEQFADALAAAPAAAAADGPVLLVGREVLPAATRAELRRLDPDRVVVVGGAAAVGEDVVTAVRGATDAEVSRVAGRSRYDTAARLSADRVAPGVDAVTVASGEDFPDALTGAAAAGSSGSPVLLVARDAVPEETAAELRRLRPGRVEVLGGTAAVSAGVADRVGRLADAPVVRRAGADRFGTAVAISAAAHPDGADVVHLATGEGFADALAGAPAATAAGGPVLLAASRCVPRPVLVELDRLAPREVVLLGGEGALGPGVARLAGCDRETSTVLSGLAQPWDVAHTPDGRVFLTERDSGRLLELVDGRAREVQRLTVDPAGEGGLLGLAVSPTYEQDGLLYLYLTAASDNRVVRLRPGGAPQPVLTGIPKARIHNGGRIAFGPDGLLYIGTGDAAVPRLAQDRRSLAGKILRVRPDGGIPSDNPFGNAVWSYGHRNVQGLAFDAGDQLLATEFGPDRDDEVNRIVAGGNYGWPEVTGTAGDPRFRDPVIVRQPAEASWSGATFVRDGAIGQWEGDLFVAALRGARLWRFRLSADRTRLVEAEELLVGEHGRLRQVTRAPDGALWVLTGNGRDDRLLRIGPPPR
jgi:glucose/arabinose dehydrogenase/putative cell wall-binding protein